MSALDKRQVGILSDRYLDVMLGDFSGFAILLLQAPLLGAGIAGVWDNLAQDTLTLYFVMSLSAFFLGAVNSAREIVKERKLFLRERMFNLSVRAYLVSKYRVQAILAISQAVILAGVVYVFVPMDVNLAAVVCVLVVTAFAGTAVGLLISSLVETSDKAVALVPLVVIPQILFSDVVIGKDRLSNWTGNLQDTMPVHWSYKTLEALKANDPDYGTVAMGFVVLLVMIAAAYVVSLFRLHRLRY